jgi:perosamine synthetase
MFSEHVVETPVSFALPERAFNLPSYHDMTDADQARVIEVVRNVLKQRGKP